MRRLLLTGASGFLGRNCLDELADDNWEVHAVDRSPLANEVPDVDWHETDLLSERKMVELLLEVKPTHLLHLAWTGERPVYRSLENVRWVSASLRLFQEFLERGGRRIVALGSSAEYSWGPEDCEESVTPLDGDTLYGICKASLGRLFAALCRQSGASGVWARPFFLYGPYENPSRLVASVTRSLLLEEAARCTHGRQIRDYLYSRDAASALVHLLSGDFNGPVNIASGRGRTLAEIVNQIASLTGREHLVRLGAVEAPADEAERVVASVSRLRDVAGWQARSTLEEGLRETIDWWRQELSLKTGLEDD